MITFQKIVVPLWRAFAEQRHQHTGKTRQMLCFYGIIRHLGIRIT